MPLDAPVTTAKGLVDVLFVRSRFSLILETAFSFALNPGKSSDCVWVLPCNGPALPVALRGCMLLNRLAVMLVTTAQAFPAMQTWRSSVARRDTAYRAAIDCCDRAGNTRGAK